MTLQTRDRQRDDITMLSMMITIERVVPNTGWGVIFIVKFRNRVTLTKQTILTMKSLMLFLVSIK